MKIIEITVSPTGETTVQTKGYQGSDCLGASRFIETTLGLTLSESKTSEFYHQVEEQQQIQQ